MPRNGSGVYSLPSGSTVVDGTTIDASDLNTPMQDLETDMNTARPVVAGGTGATTAGNARTQLGAVSLAGSDTVTATWNLSGATLTFPAASVTFANLADVLDEDDMASSSSTDLATQQSIKAYADSVGITQTSGSSEYYGARAWANFYNDAGTATLRNSKNIASVTRTATGLYTVTFTDAMPSGNYVVSATYATTNDALTANEDGQAKVYEVTTTGFKLAIMNGGAVLVDPGYHCSFVVFR